MVITDIMGTVGGLISTKMLFHFTPKTFFGAPRGEFTGKIQMRSKIREFVKKELKTGKAISI